MGNKKKKIPQVKWHSSMRGYFSGCLYNAMVDNPDIVLITGDLGYGMFDFIRDDFPDRFLNAGASEQAMMGIAVGLALKGKIPFVYSITPFLLYRPFETIRNYISHEKIPVKMIGSGRDKDYAIDGISHWAEEDIHINKLLPNIECYWPETKEEIPNIMREIIENNKPVYLNLKR